MKIDTQTDKQTEMVCTSRKTLDLSASYNEMELPVVASVKHAELTFHHHHQHTEVKSGFLQAQSSHSQFWIQANTC